MKPNQLLIISISAIIISCATKSGGNEDTQQKKEATQTTEPSQTLGITFQKATDFRNENDPEYFIYQSKKDDNDISFYTKTSTSYGVL
ncbi:MAG: hypothetical protein AAFY41_13125, partial [Bacteroidota bacterium]